MANPYRGEVEFTDSDGTKYVLRLGVNQYITMQKELEALDGVAWQRRMFAGGLTQHHPELSLEQVGDLIDDLGTVRVDELISQTRYGQMTKESIEKLQQDTEAARKKAESNGNPPKAPTTLRG